MKKQTIKEIKHQLNSIEIENDYVKNLRLDNRTGVQNALKQWDKKRLMKDRLEEQFILKNKYELLYSREGYQSIAGVDEVGRGPLAGPVVCAAVILNPRTKILGLNDSKKLSEKKRLELFEEINEKALDISIAIATPEEIDDLNIYNATKVAMKRSVEGLKTAADFLLIDAMKIDLPIPQESIIKGDMNSNSIAAASIISKVTRDAIMKEYATVYPDYDFEHNMGYGTKKHIDGLESVGYCAIHRKSFEPIKSMVT